MMSASSIRAATACRTFLRCALQDAERATVHAPPSNWSQLPLLPEESMEVELKVIICDPLLGLGRREILMGYNGALEKAQPTTTREGLSE
jgi:hypothetical protein